MRSSVNESMSHRSLLGRFSEVQICFQTLDYKSSAPGEADEGDSVEKRTDGGRHS